MDTMEEALTPNLMLAWADMMVEDGIEDDRTVEVPPLVTVVEIGVTILAMEDITIATIVTRREPVVIVAVGPGATVVVVTGEGTETGIGAIGIVVEIQTGIATEEETGVAAVVLVVEETGGRPAIVEAAVAA